jgi:2-(3-amino-3-carboxypropyl)histidine synthase
MQYELKDLESRYELELGRIIDEIKKQKAKMVLLQFPEGFKPWAMEITKYLEEKTSSEIRIWLGSCFGACDLPKSDADLIIQFGHAEW